MNPILAAGIAVSALASLHAVRSGERPRRFFLLKPLTTGLILAAALLAPPTAVRAWALLGLGLCLIGDICLLFPGDRAFMGGLGSFLIAHLAFIAAFSVGLPPGPPPVWTAIFGIYAAGMLALLWRRTGRLRIPVAVYSLALFALVLAAARTHAAHGTAASAWGLAGALTFAVSDSLLAAERFIGAFRGAQPIILSTYWAALGGLVASLF